MIRFVHDRDTLIHFFPSATAQELARPNAGESPSQLACHRAVIGIAAHRDCQRNPMLSGSSAAEIVGSYPKFSTVPVPGAVSFVLATSCFGMTARGATELTILPSLRFQALSDSSDSTGEVFERGDGISDLSRRIFPASSGSPVPPCRRPALRMERRTPFRRVGGCEGRCPVPPCRRPAFRPRWERRPPARRVALVCRPEMVPELVTGHSAQSRTKD